MKMKKQKKPQKKFNLPKPNINASSSRSWTIFIIVFSFFLSIAFSAVMSVVMNKLNIIWAFFVLFAIIAINILADCIGTAAMSAEEPPFHSLAARKVKGAAESIFLIRHASQIAIVCLDIIGDIAGIISGSATTLIVAEMVIALKWDAVLPSLILTGIVSSLTIGGKAVAKLFSMRNANSIIFSLGKFMGFFSCKKTQKDK